MSEFWKSAHFQIFDTTHTQLPFEERVQWLRDTIPDSQFVIVAKPWECSGNVQLMKQFAMSVTNGGEGLLIRKPHSHYYGSNAFFQLKVGLLMIF
jgi:ATP-dependent DNA ligase